MNYYPFHVGDYHTHTADLSALEDLAYRRLLDWSYLHECPVPLDLATAARKVRMQEHREEVGYVLREFFTETPEGWINRRVERELVTMHEKQDKQRAKALKRWQKPTPEPGIATGMPRVAAGHAAAPNADADAMPPTPTPTPTPTPVLKRETRASARPPEKPEAVTSETWADWLALRSKKRAPVTGTVLREAAREAQKAGMPLERFLQVWCARGSQGLQAEWLKPEERGGRNGYTGGYSAERNRAFAGEFADNAQPDPFTLEMEKPNVKSLPPTHD